MTTKLRIWRWGLAELLSKLSLSALVLSPALMATGFLFPKESIAHQYIANITLTMLMVSSVMTILSTADATSSAKDKTPTARLSSATTGGFAASLLFFISAFISFLLMNRDLPHENILDWGKHALASLVALLLFGIISFVGMLLTYIWTNPMSSEMTDSEGFSDALAKKLGI
ncbi:MAG TPA: hypothetical protein VED40_23155 [Azospirillaceae bacterium]|nr:hypothetical protein [Azospirillaceae bacterium]